MRCQMAKRDIYRLLDAELGDGRKVQLEEHLRVCVVCQEEAESIRMLHGILRTTGSDTRVSPGFDVAFWNKVHERQKEPWFLKLLKDLESWTPVPALSQAFAVLAIAFLIGGTGGIVSAMSQAQGIQAQRTSIQYLSGFREFKGIPSVSVAAAYLKTIEERTSS